MNEREPARTDAAFQLVGLTPAGLPDPAIALAAARAGGIGIVDFEFTEDALLAADTLRAMDRAAKGAWGIKISRHNREFVAAMALHLPKGATAVIFARGCGEGVAEDIRAFRRDGLLIVLEAASLEEALAGQAAGADAVIAKGNEAAGFVGEKTTFILLQQLAKKLSLPVWAQGGIGLHTAAACYAAGSRGLVLDSQLALLRESPLPEAVKGRIRRMDGTETLCTGDGKDMFRAYRHQAAIPGGAGAGTNGGTDNCSALRRAVADRISWTESAGAVWPLGQDVAFAAPLAHRFGTVGALFHGLRESINEHLAAAQEEPPLREGAPLARSHGTAYPIVQGPMARISDTAVFMQRVAGSGALPFVAVSKMRPREIKEILAEVKALLGDAPWGVGLLGFNESELLKAQLEAVAPFAPPFAIVAGGTPTQAAALEAKGIRAYVHVPSAALLDMFLDAGVRRFVFEGNECGGHIGPRSSFVLWESMIEKITERLEGGTACGQLQVLFAGGVHDAASAALVSVAAAPLAKRGVEVGVVMGTAYLLTRDAVETGAIVEGYLNAALGCAETRVLELSPGHAVRCCDTPFVREFGEAKRRLTADGTPTAERAAALETMIVGRSRIAAKGMDRNPAYGPGSPEPYLVPADGAKQLREGLYMVGQVAALRDAPLSVTELHEEVCRGSAEAVRSLVPLPSASPAPREVPADIAVIGMACVFPKARDVRAYWQNILDKVNVITEVPSSRWDWELYFDHDKNSKDKIYSRWGGFVEDMAFDPTKYGIPPKALQSIEPLHLMTLEVVDAALKDAGYGARPFPREKTSVIIGTGAGIGDLGQRYILRSTLPQLFEIHSDEILQRFQDWTEDSFPGILMNVLAGRVANRFNLGGVNYTIDAACASSLAALYDAVKELETGSSSMVIAGGVDTSQNPFTFTCFSKTNALSPSGKCRVFDEKADGTVISEGLALVVLKRLADAERDGDRIYAVIKAVAGSSDGRGMGLTAPRPEGQQKALDRAYRKAGFSPATVELFEAHGTGTVVGDQVEAGSLMRVLDENRAAPQSCAVGSVKSMIGHTKGAAGIAGLMKAALSLYHRVLPPTMGVKKPNSKIDFLTGPLYVNSELRPWVGNTGAPRRAGVSAFGFGGTNFHAVLEQYADEFLEGRKPSPVDAWPFELLLWSGPSRADLITAVEQLRRALEEGVHCRLGDLAFTLSKNYEAAGEKGAAAQRLAIVASSVEDLKEKLAAARRALEQQGGEGFEDPRGIYISGAPSEAGGKIALLFPGQGSQYPSMLREAAIFFPEVLGCFERANAVLRERIPQGLASFVFPPPAFGEEQEKAHKKNLARTDIAQPALGAAGYGMLSLLRALGIAPDMSAGHSYGEYAALAAAGVLDEETLYAVSEARGRLIIEASAGKDLGAMAAVKAGQSEVQAALEGIDGVVVANINSPRQTVIAGERAALEKAVTALKAKSVHAQALPVSAAFHSPLVAPAKGIFSAFLNTVPFRAPRMTVYSNTLAAPHSASLEEIKACLAEHMVAPVEFVREIEAMYADGARVFIETGPGSVLTNLTRQILDGRPFLAVALDAQGQPGLQQLLKALGRLAADAVPFSPARLFRGRALRVLDLGNLKKEEGPLPPTVWRVNGTRVYQPSQQWKPRAAAPQLQSYRLRDRRRRPGAVPAPPPSAVPEENSKAQQKSTQEFAMPLPLPAEPLLPAPPAAEGDVDTVMQRYHQLMSQFLEMQKTIMTAYLQAEPQPLPSAPAAQPAVQQPAALQPEKPCAAKQPVAEPAQPAAEAAEPQAPKRADDERLKQDLLRITSERTGYPVEMLNLDFDVEAELGIDSIKRVEILSAFVKGLPAELQDRVRPLMDDLSRMRTLKGMLERASAAAAPACAGPIEPTAEPAAALAVAVTAGAPLAPATSNGEHLAKALLKVTGERTGYPEEMLDLDLDVEADFGIDSIKRVEILGAFVKSLSEPEQAKVRPLMDDLSRLRSLRSIIERTSDAIAEDLSRLKEVKKVAAAASAPAPAATEGSENVHVPRMLIEEVPAPLPCNDLNVPAGGVVVITDDGRGVAALVAEELKRKGGIPVILSQGSGGADGDVYRLDLGDQAAVNTAVEDIYRRSPSFVGLLHLLPLRQTVPFEGMGLLQWREHLRVETKGLFSLARALSADLRAAGKRERSWFIAATSLSGIGMDAAVGQAGMAGFVKTLAAEWPEVTCRVVHLESAEEPRALAGRLLGEMALTEGPAEVAYRGAERVAFEAREAPLNRQKEQLRIERDWVILVTGGAVGITAEVAQVIAEKYQPTLVLVGRSALPGAEEAPDTAGLAAAGELKTALIQRAKNAGEPLALPNIEATYARLLREREMRRNLAALRATGASVHYFRADVRDEEGFGGLIDRIYTEFGRIDGVIHGAGIIEDKLVENKTKESFDRVFDTKTESAFILKGRLRSESLRFIAFFTSVAGAFGNRGQADYAAANEVVNSLARALDRSWTGRVLAINWGPWKKFGMVTPEVERQFNERGIQVIPPAAGSRLFEEELRYGRKGEVVVVAGDGPWKK